MVRRILTIASIAAALVGLFAMVSCRSAKVDYSTPVVLNNADSVRVETITITKLDTVTAYVEVPAQSAERQIFDGKSHLETDFAESDARINDDGSLFHMIKNKPQSLAADVAVPITSQETNTVNVCYKEVPVYVPTYIEVERDFTSWERFRLKAFWYFVILSMAGVCWIIRKPLISVIKNFVD